MIPNTGFIFFMQNIISSFWFPGDISKQILVRFAAKKTHSSREISLRRCLCIYTHAENNSENIQTLNQRTYKHLNIAQ